MKILVSALEPSANLHLKEILDLIKDSQIYGIFDSKFGKPFMDSSEFSAMGFLEVLPLVFKAKRALKEMVNLAKECDQVLLIDSPAFNLRLAKMLKNANIKAKITYYILPQVWAWKEKRVALVEKYCDNLASILPFDSKFYSKSIYVGHPLLDEIKVQKSQISQSGKIAFLPGSRRSEISRLMPIFREILPNFKDKECLLVVPAHFMDKISEVYGDTSSFKVVSNTPQALFESEFAFICSGTATLESALIGTPFVLCYKAKAFDIWLARKLVKVKFAGLANIIFDFMQEKPLHFELIGDEVSAANLLKAYFDTDKEQFLGSALKLREYLKFGSAKNVAQILNQN